ncbi:MAG TPA: 3-phosphoshikimate 1-carboxyvinyltransferase [Thermoanaerobaculia bacterium]|jgi:3-phosphoshikimate 1-carboxyvinyltransferase|nr:3-phosphoshikimate 1-carboxyvinyltransferase [Thermoanaerobaculia bacterium]
MTASPSIFGVDDGAEAARAIPAGRRASGSLEVPPSKSVTHRYLNLALLAGVPLVLERPLDADDTRLFLSALEACGFTVERTDGEIRLTPGERSIEREIEIYCGNAGTMFRFLVATLAAIPGTFRLDGTPRLRERPIGPLIDAVRRLGGEVEYLEHQGYAPLAIHGGTLRGGTTSLDAGSSSQYLSALLMAGLRAQEPVIIEVSALTSEPYIDVTLDVARRFGGRIERLTPTRFQVNPASRLGAGLERGRVEGDWSAAAYPAAMAVVTGGAVRLLGLEEKSAQGDRGFLDLLASMGAEISWHWGELTVSGTGWLTALSVDLGRMPDQVPTLAALAPFAVGTTRISGVPHLRIKESDRLHAMAVGLAALGVPVSELPDGLEIEGIWAGRTDLPSDPVTIDPFDDHRIAMSFALLGLRRSGVTIADPGVVAKSYPEFWRDFDRLTAE